MPEGVPAQGLDQAEEHQMNQEGILAQGRDQAEQAEHGEQQALFEEVAKAQAELREAHAERREAAWEAQAEAELEARAYYGGWLEVWAWEV